MVAISFPPFEVAPVMTKSSTTFDAAPFAVTTRVRVPVPSQFTV
jgi:hypothetical protein